MFDREGRGRASAVDRPDARPRRVGGAGERVDFGVTKDVSGPSSASATVIAGWVHLGFVGMSLLGAYLVVDLATGDMWYARHLHGTVIDCPVPALPLDIRDTWRGFLVADAVLAFMLMNDARAARALGLVRAAVGLALAALACRGSQDMTGVLAIPYYVALGMILLAGRNGRGLGVFIAVTWLALMTMHRIGKI